MREEKRYIGRSVKFLYKLAFASIFGQMRKTTTVINIELVDFLRKSRLLLETRSEEHTSELQSR